MVIFQDAIFSFFKKLTIIFFTLSLFSTSLFSIDIDSSNISHNEDEALFLRRVIDFWDEGKREAVKIELENYLGENSSSIKSSSDFIDYLNALLGDIYLCEESLSLAVDKYSKIGDGEIKENIYVNYIQSLYELKRYEEVCKENLTCPEMMNVSDKDTYLRYSYILGDSYYKQALVSEDADKKHDLAISAKLYLGKLVDSPFEDKVIEHLANVESVLQNYNTAASIYLKLAGRYEERKEEFLFQAATMQMAYDKDLALQTFTQICHIGKEKKREAAFNRFLLLIEAEKWSDIILAKEQFDALLVGDQKMLLNFYVAKSHYLLQNDQKAAVAAIEYVDNNYEFTGYTKSILQMLASLGEKLNNEKLLDSAIDKFEKYAPEDIDLAAIYLSRAIFHKKEKIIKKRKMILPLSKIDSMILSRTHICLNLPISIIW